jgi:carotenoid cleavage dioxygenase-like enzyme
VTAVGTRPGDVTPNPHLHGVFSPVTAETDAVDLVVEGELPPEMDGLFLRNGPNPRFTPLGSYVYPLDGDGMVHGLWVADGRARYANRFVHTPALDAEITAGRALWGGIMSPVAPDEATVGPKLAGAHKDLPDINVVRHGGRLLALGESICPYRLSPELESLGRETFDGAIPVGMTAHPKVDPLTGEMALFCYGLEPPYLTWAMIGPDGLATRTPTPITGVDRPVMIHDMALTARYLVVILAPLYFDMAAAMSGGSLLAWRPEDGTRVALIPRDGGDVRWVHDEAFWSWHSANAHDADDGTVVLDYVEWAYPGGVTRGGPNPGGLARAVMDPVRGTVARRWLAEPGSVEFPRIDDRRIGQAHHTIAVGATSGRHTLISGEHDAVLWLDATTGSTVTWDAGGDTVGEPVFVPRPGDPADDHGWWVTYAIDRTDESSSLVVIPAGDPAAGPVARVRIPTRVPLGLHGAWLPTEE